MRQNLKSRAPHPLHFRDLWQENPQKPPLPDIPQAKDDLMTGLRPKAVLR